MRSIVRTLTVLAAVATSATAAAEVVQSSPAGFVTRDDAAVGATPGEVWRKLIDPVQYWNPEHSWTLDGANFTLDARAGGCFCEAIPAPDDSARAGSVEHMRVIYAAPGKMLRMQGALGPLQSEALDGTLTVTLEPAKGGTRIVWEYVVGGYSRFPLEQIAPAVDGVQTEQLTRLAALFADGGD